jgi:hypothetical protein
MQKSIYSILLILVMSITVSAQYRDIQNWRPNDKRGLNVFEDPIVDTVQYQEFLVRVGGDFTMQFQGLNQSNEATQPGHRLRDLGTDFNLPSANLNLDVQLAPGMRMHLRTYLSARHHAEAWIKGGHMQISNLDFISPGFLENIMQYTTVTIGLDEFNYGDAHFRRSDNARTIFNPFVGNYIMDAFSTEAFGEVTLQTPGGLLAVIGLTNGKLNQNVVVTDASDNKPSFYGKLGFDSQLTDDLRVRLTGSLYTNQGTTTGTWLYGGDRAGSRYYSVLHNVGDPGAEPPIPTQGTNFDGRYNARFTKLTAFQINPFIKFGGLEFFGVYEVAGGSNEIQGDTEGSFTQMAGELLYRFGGNENFYIGGRYNTIDGKMRESHTENLQISRYNIGAGWFMTRNVLTKIEYVNQVYEGGAWTGRFAGAEFSGFVIEAAISF